MASLVMRFSGINGSVYLAGFLTGPLLAHALGPDGRGQLAAILVPVSLAPLIFSAGLPTFASRAAARGEPPGELLATVGAMCLALGALGTLIGIVAAPSLAEGREVVLTMLIVGFALLPIGLLTSLIYLLGLGLACYKEVARSRIISPLLLAAGIGTLVVLEQLTVRSAAIASVVAGLASVVPLLWLLPELMPLRLSRSVARRAASFGARVWVGGLSATANARLDQLLMIKLVSERQLGLYAVAVSFAGLLTIVSHTPGGLVGPRVARGDFDLARRTLRVTVLLATMSALVLSPLAWLGVPLLFGAEFQDAVAMACILLAAGIPLAGTAQLASSLVAAGHAGIGSIAQTLGLVATVASLPFVLPAMGALGAALISLAAYSLVFAFLLQFSCRRLGRSLREHLIVSRRDLLWLRAKGYDTIRRRSPS